MGWWHKTWQCPFFRWDDRRRVACEWGCTMKFPDGDTARRFMERYCASVDGWPACTVAGTIGEYYDRKEARHD